MKIIKFYSENNEYGFLSNFASYPIEIDSLIYPTTEHYFQAQKFTDKKLIEKIRKSKTPMEAAIIGRNKNNPLRRGWESMKDNVMLEALRMKVNQHDEIRTALLQTENAILIEHTKNDSYWGDGGDGKGHNRLGKLWMKVRKEIGGL